MRKTVSILVATVLLLTMSLGVTAEDLATEFTYVHETNAPDFEIIFESAVDLAEGGTDADIQVVGMASLGGQTVHVYVAGATPFGGSSQHFRLNGTASSLDFVPYNVVTANGNTLEYRPSTHLLSQYPTVEDRELAFFTEDDTKSFTAVPLPTEANSGEYRGTLTYGVYFL